MDGDSIQSKAHNRKKWLLVAIFLIFAAGAAKEVLRPEEEIGVVDLLITLFVSLLSYLWFRADAWSRGYEPSKTLRFAIVLISGLSFPYYFYRTRGALGAVLSTAKAIGFLLAACMAGSISCMVICSVAKL